MVTRDGELVQLSRTEWLLLQHLAANAGKVVLHTELLTKVWGPEYRDDLQYLRVWVSRVRRKLGAEPGEPGRIKTFQGIGYLLDVEPATPGRVATRTSSRTASRIRRSSASARRGAAGASRRPVAPAWARRVPHTTYRRRPPTVDAGPGSRAGSDRRRLAPSTARTTHGPRPTATRSDARSGLDQAPRPARAVLPMVILRSACRADHRAAHGSTTRRPCATLGACSDIGPGRALVVVDLQNDFADPAGGLSVAGGDAIVPTVNGEIAMARNNGALSSPPRTGTPSPRPTSPRTAASGRSTASRTRGARRSTRT